MKIAIIMAGEPRFSQQLDNFISNLQGFETVDWYFYLWKESFPFKHPRVQVPKNWVNIPSRAWAIETIQNNLPNNHKVIDVQLGSQQEVINELGINGRDSVHVHSIYKQFYSLHKADLLRRNSGIDYDLVVRGRLDLDVSVPINLLEIKNIIDQQPTAIITPGVHMHGQYSINDQLAISSPKNMEIYTNLVLHIDRYAEHGVTMHPETLVGFNMLNHGLDIHRSIYTGDCRHAMNAVGFGSWGAE